MRARKFVAWTLYGSMGFLTTVGMVTIAYMGYSKFIAPEQPAQAISHVKKGQTAAEVPEIAESNAYYFAYHWFTVNPKEGTDKKIKRLDRYITPTLKEELEEKPSLLPQAKKKGVEVTNVATGNVEWVQPGTTAEAEMRVDFSDGRTNYFRIPVEKTGETYRVSGLPALYAEPKAGAAKEPADVELEQEETIKPMLANFFPGWLAGNKELISRYTTREIPSTDLLKDMAAIYRDVTVEPISEDPVKVRAFVVLEDGNKNTFTMEYVVTLEKQGGSWKIKELQD